MHRTPEERMLRTMRAGAYTMRHWRGVLLSIWLGAVASFGLLAWWGYANRDRGWGSFTFTLFGFIVLLMLLRFPRRLIRSMWAARGTEPSGLADRHVPTRGSIIDADAVTRDADPPPPPPVLDP